MLINFDKFSKDKLFVSFPVSDPAKMEYFNMNVGKMKKTRK